MSKSKKIEETLIPPDMAVEIERYMASLQARHPDKPVQFNDVIRKLLRFGLDKVKGHAFVPLRLVPQPSDEPINEPINAVAPPVRGDQLVTHAWAAGLVLPCGIWKKGNRHTTNMRQVSCPTCRAKVGER